MLEAGAVWPITWNVSEERGPNNGEVDLEYSVNGGADWIEIARGTTNDGYHAWLVPSQPAADVRVRVSRPHRDAYAPAIYPDVCSFDGSDSSFSIVAPPPLAGSIPPGPGDAGLTVQTDAGGLLRLRWSASCSGDVEDHAVYRGSLDALRAGSWDHAPVTCSAGVDLVEYVDPGPGDVYFLVAPLAGGAEGEMGRDSGGQPRPSSASACAPREADSTCD